MDKRFLPALAALALLSLAPLACAPAAISPAGEAPADSAIDYRRTGGLAGLDDHLIIQPNGSAQLTRRGSEQRFTLTQAEHKQLTAALERAGFDKLASQYLPKGRGADLFEYTLSYRGRTVRTQDTAVPEALQPVLSALNDIIGKVGRP